MIAPFSLANFLRLCSLIWKCITCESFVLGQLHSIPVPTCAMAQNVASLHWLLTFATLTGLPGWRRRHSGKEPTCQCRRRRFNYWVRRIPWRWKWQLTPVFLPGKSHGQRSLAGSSPWSCERVGHNSVTKQHIVITTHLKNREDFLINKFMEENWTHKTILNKIFTRTI